MRNLAGWLALMASVSAVGCRCSDPAPPTAATREAANVGTGSSPAVPPITRGDAQVVLWLRRAGEHQVQVLGQIGGGESTAQDLAKLVTAGDARIVSTDDSAGKVNGRLTGETRIECDDIVLARFQPTGPGTDEIMVTGSSVLRPRPVVAATAGTDTADRLTKALGGKRQGEPDRNARVSPIDNILRADLDGDGTDELLVASESIGPDEKVQHSVIAVLPAGESPATLIGHHGSGTNDEDAHLAHLWGIADVDGDGVMELAIMHTAPWIHYHRLVLYQWNKGVLTPKGEHVWAERDCYPSDDWPAP